MFGRIRKRLTFLYTGFMILFLLTFTALSYFTLSQFLYHDSKQEILLLAQRELGEHTEDFIESLEKEESGDFEEDDEKRDAFSPQPSFSRSFYLLVSREGQLIKAYAPPALLEPKNLQKILAWVPNSGEVRFETLQLSKDETIHVALAGNTVSKDGHFLGTVYTGTDISQQRHVLDRYIWILIGLSAVFILLSSVMSYFMAGKAMNPIVNAFRRQREFVADASHELRTPLTVIQSSLEVLSAEDKEQLSDFSKQILDDLLEETERMGKLLSDLLTLARVDSGVMEISYQSFPFQPMAESLLRSFHPLAAKKGIQLTLGFDEEYEVSADPERIRQLLYILMDNALRYTPKGGKVTLDARRVKGKDHFLQISVSDTGIGISEEHQKRIFDRFYRTDKARSREHGGTGLGLSIAQWIIQSHRGGIDVESTPGSGTTFIVTLPILL